jgi:hypothetical protein
VLEQQVDERVADRGQAQQHRADGEPAQVPLPQQSKRGAQRGPLRGGEPGSGGGGLGLRARAARNEEQQHQHPRRGDAEAHCEHGVVTVGGLTQDQERGQRAQQGAGGVHRPVHAEGAAARFRGRRQ